MQQKKCNKIRKKQVLSNFIALSVDSGSNKIEKINIKNSI